MFIKKTATIIFCVLLLSAFSMPMQAGWFDWYYHICSTRKNEIIIGASASTVVLTFGLWMYKTKNPKTTTKTEGAVDKKTEMEIDQNKVSPAFLSASMDLPIERRPKIDSKKVSPAFLSAMSNAVAPIGEPKRPKLGSEAFHSSKISMDDLRPVDSKPSAGSAAQPAITQNKRDANKQYVEDHLRVYSVKRSWL